MRGVFHFSSAANPSGDSFDAESSVECWLGGIASSIMWFVASCEFCCTTLVEVDVDVMAVAVVAYRSQCAREATEMP